MYLFCTWDTCKPNSLAISESTVNLILSHRPAFYTEFSLMLFQEDNFYIFNDEIWFAFRPKYKDWRYDTLRKTWDKSDRC